MGFHVGDLIFEKVNGGVRIRKIGDKDFENLLTADDWISIITEVSHKPENAAQHEKAKIFHLGKK